MKVNNKNDYPSPVTDFRRAARATPDKVAVIDDNARYTYQQLEHSANSIARAIELQPDANRPVLVILETSFELVAAMIGVTISGHPYSMVDINLGAETISDICSLLGASTVVTNTQQKIRLQTKLPVEIDWIVLEELDMSSDIEPILMVPEPESQFVVFFTSGSTGKPKGISISYSAFLYRIYEDGLSEEFNKDDVLALLVSLVFIRPIKVVWLGLDCGATIAMADLKSYTLSEAVDWMERNNITYAQVSSRFGEKLYDHLAVQPGIPLPSLRMMDIGGEKISSNTLGTYIHAQNLPHKLRYSIGSSETSTYFFNIYDHKSQFDPELRFYDLTRGYVLAILREDGSIATRDAAGEILVASNKLFSGYLNGPSNDEIFVLDESVPEGKYFKTGDLGDLDSQGNLSVIGRKDLMVKVRGYRIDLGEIANRLRANPRIQDTHIGITTNRRGEKQIAAYLVFNSGQNCTVTELKNELLMELEPYKLPQRYIILESMPYGPAGKIDPNRLPLVSKQRPFISSVYTAPENELEEQLAVIWQEILDLDLCGVNDNFFELGGDSINILEMISVVEQKFDSRVPSLFIDEPTIRSLRNIINNPKHFSQLSSGSEERRQVFKKNRDTFYREKYEDNLLIRTLGIVINRLSWENVFNLAAQLSGNFLIRSIFFYPYRRWYERWLDITGFVDRERSYRKFIFATLINLLPKIKHSSNSEVGKSIPELLESRSTFLNTFAREIINTPPGTLPKNFPITGFENFLNALDSKKPVFLISTHSNIRFATLPIAEYFAGIEPVVTITHNRGISGKYGLGFDKQDPLIRNASNAGVTIDALGFIAQGRVLAFFGDTRDPLTKNFSFNILGKSYNLKGGFAEIGLSVGALILPVFAHISDDLKIVLAFQPPLKPKGNTYEEQVQNLTEQYAQIIQKMWQEHPETMYISRIKKHIRGLVDENA